MKKICICLLILAASIQVSANEKTDSLKVAVTKLSNAFVMSNSEELKEYLSPSFGISIASLPSAENYYLKFLIDRKLIKSVEYVSLAKQENDVVHVNVKYVDAQDKEVESTIAFDQHNKILYSDYMDSLFSRTRNAESIFVGKIPFSQKDSANSILLQVKINDHAEVLTFLFDTGANGIALNAALAERIGIEATRSNEAHVVGGTIKTGLSENNIIHLSDNIILKNQRIAMVPGFSDKYDGVIGLNIARDHIVNVDFDKKEIALYTFGDYRFGEEGHCVNILAKGGLLFIPAILDLTNKKEVQGNFLFDTGANYHVIGFTKFVRKNRLLLSGFKPEKEGSTVSMGVRTPVFSGVAHHFKVTDEIELNNMPITLQASSTGQSAPASSHEVPDGSIGIDFISQYNFTIDLLRKIVHFVPIEKK